MLPWASSHTDDTPASTSTPTPPAVNGSVRAHAVVTSQEQKEQIYLGRCGIPPSGLCVYGEQSQTESFCSVSVGSRRRGRLWRCLRFRGGGLCEASSWITPTGGPHQEGGPWGAGYCEEGQSRGDPCDHSWTRTNRYNWTRLESRHTNRTGLSLVWS